MSRAILAAAIMTAVCFTGAGYAQSSKPSAVANAKKAACKAEAKAKNITDKAQRSAFVKDCQSRN